MERKYYLLNLTFLLWLFALLAWCLGEHTLARIAGLLAVAAFIIQLVQGWIIPMFKKQKPAEASATPTTPAPVNETVTSALEKHTNTVIASDVHVEGNIVSATPVYIHGSLHGNITAPEGLIKVMRTGSVEGNVTCRELIIDGTIQGQCLADTVEIYENGRINGTLAYRQLAIKKGGQFIGQADIQPPEQTKNNVVGLKTEASLAQSDKPADGLNEQKKSQHPAG
ncbi:polymer-forming cytoskeletal protein [Yokenella regensburgei]|uniref:bactofilin family protein n=1 Tax=Yokenella regensburgei TaxID=158877 RepID=UPI003F15DD9B